MIKQLLLLVLISVPLFFDAQTIRFNNRSIKDGLTQSSILTLIEDEKGFIWAGTQDGLNRYDGYRFKTFKHRIDDKHSLSNSFINSVKQDQKSLQIWIGTQNGGLNRYDPISSTFYTFPKDNILSKIDVQQLAIDNNGSIWFTTQNNGLYHYWPSNEKLEKYNTSNGFPFNKLNQLFIDGNNIWVGTKGRGIIVFNKKTKKNVIIDETKHLVDNTILTFSKFNKENILVGTNHGINSINKETFKVTTPKFLNNSNIDFATCFLIKKDRCNPG